MKQAVFIFAVLFVCLSSCTKEEYIEFIPSETDTLAHVFSYDLTGTYKGRIYDILWVSQNQYREGESEELEVKVSELDYTYHSFENITNKLPSSATVEVLRLSKEISNSQYAAFLTFELGSMSVGLRPDSVFFDINGTFLGNGRYDDETSTLEYFISYDNGTTVQHQVFQGTRVE